MKTNLDKLRLHFPSADFDAQEDTYHIEHYTIDWMGQGEDFVLLEIFNDRDTNASWYEDVFRGTFDQCLSHLLSLPEHKTGRGDT